MQTLSETCLVALTLSGVARLHQAFQASDSAYDRERLLLAAADLLDRTLPYPDLKAKLAKPGVDQVQALIAGRMRIAAVPSGLWRVPRVRPNELGAAHYSGVRALDRALKKDFSRPELMWNSLSSWLQPAWKHSPELAQESLELRGALSQE